MLNKYANGQVIFGFNCYTLDKVLKTDEYGKELTLGDLTPCKADYSQLDLEKIDKEYKEQTTKSQKQFDDKNKRIIIDMTNAGHPPREIMKAVKVCRQYIDKIKRKYKNALTEITREQNSKRAVS